MADVEVIEDSSSQEEAPAAQPVKKKGKTKKDATATGVHPSSTLTRFLALQSGTPSVSAGEDVNLPCPVCQRGGFTSRALAFHVNHCLDVSAARKHEVAGADAQRSAKESRGVGGRTPEEGSSKPAAAPAAAGHEVEKPASDGHSSTASSRSRKGGAGVSRAAVDRNVVNARDCGQKHPSDNRGKKGAPRRTHVPPVRKRSEHGAAKTGVSQGRDQEVGEAKSLSKPRQSHLSSPTQLSSPGATQPTSGRRRGVLSRPRGNAGSHAIPVPHASGQKENEELALCEIARTQLLCVLETERGKTRHGGWMGTQLFPKPTADAGLVDDIACGVARGGSEGVVRTASFSETARGLGGEGRMAGTRAGRVRPRPASWDPLSCAWLEMWPHGFDDCRGDGDGYLTLSPFPSREGRGGPGVPCSGGEQVLRRSDGDAQLRSNGEDGDAAPTSRAERFLAVFDRLQPARTALNLEVSVPPPSVGKTPQSSAVGKTRPSPSVVKTPPSSAVVRTPLSSSVCKTPQPSAVGKTPPLPSVGKTEKPAASSPSRSAAVGGSATVGCLGRNNVAAQSRVSVPGNRGVRGKSGGAKAVAVAHSNAKAGELSTPAVKRPQVEMGARASDGIDKKKRVEARAAEDTRSLRETGLENDRAALSSRGPVPTGPVPSRTPALRHSPDWRQPVVAPDDRHHATPRPSATPQVGSSGNGQVKQVTDVIDMTSESPPRSAAGVGRNIADAANLATGGMHDVAYRLRATLMNGRVKMPVNDGASPKDITPPLSSEWRRRRRMDPALSPSKATPACPRSSRGTHASRPPATPVRPHATSHRAADPVPRERSLAGSGGARSRLEPVSVNVERDLKRGAGVIQGKRVVQAKRAGGHSQLDNGSTKVSGGQWIGAEPRGGAFPSACSSGVLRSADVSEGVGGGVGGTVTGGLNGEAPETGRGVLVLPFAVNGGAAVSSSRGHKADVAQKGMLTVVDAKHGATIRNSWSIDESDELGRLKFGVSLKYDAVWYFPAADDDCVGVLRYRIVPHSILAPKGGWISGEGRLRSDPRTIVKATPAAAPSLAHASPGPTQLPSGSYQRRDGNEGGEGQNGGGDIRSSSSNSQEQHLARHQQAKADRRTSSTRAEEEPGSIRCAQPGAVYSQASQAGKPKESARYIERHQDRRKQHHHCHIVTTAAGGSRRTQALSAASPEVSRSKGGFGRATSLSPEVSEDGVTGDKVTCPLCHRGMDHWQPKQRQQHVHGCLLKEPSSATKAAPAATNAIFGTPSTERSAGLSNRSTEVSRGSASSSNLTPTSDPALSCRRNLGEGGAGESESKWQDARCPSPAEGPRPTRVSLQQVFSPKATRDTQRIGNPSRDTGHALDGTPCRHSVSAASGRAPFKGNTVTCGISGRPAADGDARNNRNISASRGVGVGLDADKKSAVAKGLLECPVCRLSFAGGRLGQWERQAHVQQCLDGLEGVFGPEE